MEVKGEGIHLGESCCTYSFRDYYASTKQRIR